MGLYNFCVSVDSSMDLNRVPSSELHFPDLESELSIRVVCRTKQEGRVPLVRRFGEEFYARIFAKEGAVIIPTVYRWKMMILIFV